MNTKTLILASIALIVTYYLGFSLFICILAYNVVFWADILYSLISSEKKEISQDLVKKVHPSGQDPAQIEFERFLLKRLVELSPPGDQSTEH